MVKPRAVARKGERLSKVTGNMSYDGDFAALHNTITTPFTTLSSDRPFPPLYLLPSLHCLSTVSRAFIYRVTTSTMRPLRTRYWKIVKTIINRWLFFFSKLWTYEIRLFLLVRHLSIWWLPLKCLTEVCI